jgi:hypothetical protein
MTSQQSPPAAVPNFNLDSLKTLEHPWQRPDPHVPYVYSVELCLQNAAGIQINHFKMPFVFSDHEEAAVCAGQSFRDLFEASCDSNTQSCLRCGHAAISGNYRATLNDGCVGIVKVIRIPVWVIGDEPEDEDDSEAEMSFRRSRRDTVHGESED